MWIWILLDTLMRIRIKLSILMRILIQLPKMKRIRIRKTGTLLGPSLSCMQSHSPLCIIKYCRWWTLAVRRSRRPWAQTINWDSHEDKFLVPHWGDKVNSGVVPARQSSKAGGPVQQTYAGVNYVPQSGTMNLATGEERKAQIGPSVQYLIPSRQEKKTTRFNTA